MTEKEWNKIHLGSIVEYTTFNLGKYLFGGMLYGGYNDCHRVEVLGIRADKKIFCKKDGDYKPRWHSIKNFDLVEEK